MRVHYWVIISRDVASTQFLSGVDGRLPHYFRSSWTYWQGTAHLIEAMRQKYGLDLIVHRCVGIFDQPDQSMDVAYAGELRQSKKTNNLMIYRSRLSMVISPPGK